MPKPADKAEKERLLPVLWALFVLKVDREWIQKYSFLGTNRLSVSPYHLSEAVLADVHQAPPTGFVHALEQYFREDALSSNLSLEELSFFIRYLGFSNWAAFKAQCDEDAAPSTSSTKGKTAFRDKDPWFHIGPIVLLLLHLA